MLVSELNALANGAPFQGTYLVVSKEMRSGKSQYLAIKLADKTGLVEARVWDVATKAQEIKDFNRDDIVEVSGTFSPYNGQPQVKVDRLVKVAPEKVNKADLLPPLPATAYNVDELWAQLTGFVDSFTDPHLKQLVFTLLADERIGAAFRVAPAAKQLHHAWLNGLLEHVVSLLKLADRVVAHYNEVLRPGDATPVLHRDLVLTGVILHDIGKTEELSWETSFEYTTEGMLLGHIQIGYELAAKTMDSLPGFPPRLRTLVLHMILSHHGKLEFGSPKLPMIPEALVLSFIDDLDAKMMAAEQTFRKGASEGRRADELTEKVWALDQRQLLNTRAWLASAPAPAPAAAAGVEEKPQEPAAVETVVEEAVEVVPIPVSAPKEAPFEFAGDPDPIQPDLFS